MKVPDSIEKLNGVEFALLLAQAITFAMSQNQANPIVKVEASTTGTDIYGTMVVTLSNGQEFRASILRSK